MAKKSFGDRWENIGSVGEGGQARTFRVRDRRDGSTNWILKQLKNRNRLGRFEREILALEALDSPYIPKTEDYSIGTPAFHVSKDLGTSLNKYILSNPLNIDEALNLFEHIVSAVRDAHSASIVHRDIKPDNIVIAPDGAKAYLIDFGICQYSQGELTLLTTDEAFGNPAFAAPENFLGREEEPGPPSDVYSLGKLLYWMVSRGHYINRERLSPLVLERIATKHNLIRFYLAQLLRGTVIENPGGRWTASRLLEEVRTTQKLLDRVRQYERRGQIVLSDGFGLEDSFNRTSFRSTTTKDPKYPPSPPSPTRVGPTPGDQDIGTAFEVPANRDIYLETITLAISYGGGEDELDVWLTPDLDGKPDAQNILETFKISGSRSIEPRIESVHSQDHPLLQRGHLYWILLSAAAPHSEIALWGAPLDFIPRPELIAECRNGGEWEVRKSPSGPGSAVRVIGRPDEPE